MSGHLAVELLSSYLDAEVSRAELRLVEKHLDECSECRRTVAGLRSVSDSVRRLEAVAPPASLAASVERGVERASLEAAGAYRLEESLRRWMAQPVLAPVFAIVLALGAILYLFASGVARDEANKTRLVIAAAPAESEDAPPPEAVRREDIALDAAAKAEASATEGASSVEQEQPSNAPVASAADEHSAQVETLAAALEARGTAARAAPVRPAAPSAERRAGPVAGLEMKDAPVREVGGRRFSSDGATWVEIGLEDAIVGEVEAWRRLTEPERTELEAFRELGRVRVQIGGRVVEVVYPDHEAPGE